MSEFLSKLFSWDFMTHGHCYFSKPEIVWLHAISDDVIAFAYYFIPLALIYFVRKRRDVLFGWIFLLFGIFILGCGTKHILEIWTLWHGTYRLAGVLKAITAVTSVITAAALVPLIPRALALRSPERRRAERALQEAHGDLELRVQQRTAELGTANERLQAEISEHRRTSDELRKSEERWRTAFENSGVSIALTDVDGRFLAVNSAYRKMLGYSADELRPLSFLDFTREEDRDANGTLLAELMETRQEHFTMEKRCRRKAGKWIWVNVDVSLVPATHRVPRFAIAISQDITERKRAEEETRKLVSPVENSTNFIGIASTGGEMLFVNKAGQAQVRETGILDYLAGQERRPNLLT